MKCPVCQSKKYRMSPNGNICKKCGYINNPKGKNKTLK